MPAKKTTPAKPKWDDPEESKRFLETAEAVGASDDPKDLDKALKKIAPRLDSKRQG